MDYRVNIGEAKDRFSQLIAAAKRGEDVVIARDGVPEVRLVPVDPDAAATQRAAIEKRMSAFGMYASTFDEKRSETLLAPLSDSDWGLDRRD